MTIPMFDTSILEKPRRRLIRQYHRLGSYQKVADVRGVNIRYVYEFIKYYSVPQNKNIQRSLGIYLHKPVSIDQLFKLPVHETPPEILLIKLNCREEIKND